MSKRIGIISDTHSLLRSEVLEVLRGCDCIFHAGDVTIPQILDELRPLGSLYAVRGNNDRGETGKLSGSLSFTIEGIKFFMVHDKKDVARNLSSAQVIIFGHTHKYFEKVIDGKLWLNPGSCGYQRFGQEATMAVMTVDNGKYQVEKIVIAEERV